MKSIFAILLLVAITTSCNVFEGKESIEMPTDSIQLISVGEVQLIDDSTATVDSTKVDSTVVE